jgi:hypothetical protein
MSIASHMRMIRGIGFLTVFLSLLFSADRGFGIDDPVAPTISLSAVAFPKNRMWIDVVDGTPPMHADPGVHNSGPPRLYAPITDTGPNAAFFHAVISYRLSDPDEKSPAQGFSDLPWDIVLEIDGFRHEKADSDRRQQEPETDSIFLSPGIRISAPSGISASFSVGGPVWERHRGAPGVPGLRTIFTVGVEF